MTGPVKVGTEQNGSFFAESTVRDSPMYVCALCGVCGAGWRCVVLCCAVLIIVRRNGAVLSCVMLCGTAWSCLAAFDLVLEH